MAECVFFTLNSLLCFLNSLPIPHGQSKQTHHLQTTPISPFPFMYSRLGSQTLSSVYSYVFSTTALSEQQKATITLIVHIWEPKL
jgi:hypothetical protein